MRKKNEIVCLEEWCHTNRGKYTLAQISDAVTEEFELPRLGLNILLRNRHMTDARKSFCWFSRKVTRHSLNEIGDFIDRDHTSIINLYTGASDLVDIGDTSFAIRLQNIHQSLTAIVL